MKTSIVYRDSSLLVVGNCVVNFIVAFLEQHGVSFSYARMIDIVKDVD